MRFWQDCAILSDLGRFARFWLPRCQICTNNALAGLCGAVVSLFGGNPSVALAVDGLQIARMVYLGLRPAAQPRLGLADDVVNLVGRRDAQPPTQAVGALAHPVGAAQYLDAQLLPRIAVAALVSVATLAISTPAGGRFGGLEQFGA